MRARGTYATIVAALAAMSCVLAGSTAAAGPEATVSSVSPQQAIVGQLVTISGTNLNGTKSVLFGTTAAKSVVVDPGGKWVRAVVPSGTPSGSVVIHLNDVNGASIGPITIAAGSMPAQPNPKPTATSGQKAGAAVKVVRAPRITAFSPSVGRPGMKVTITGVNFGHSLWVKIGGIRSQHFTVSGSTTIVATVPTRVHTGKIKVHSSAGTGVSAQAFKVASQ
jgi:IPT/TIG domain-containing protein